jgi:hypothetical protein
MGAAVELDPRTVAAEPGGKAVVGIRVRNTGSVVDQFALEVLGDAAPWASIEPPTISLFPGSEGAATVTFKPPRSPSVRAGALPFGLRVQSQEDPAGSVVDEGTVEVAPFNEVTADLVPRNSRGSTGATHDLAVDNRGNVPLNATLNALDADRLLDFELRPPAVLADPGAAVFAKLRVKPKRTFWRGGAVTRPFQVQLDVPGGTPLTLDGALLQTPILPPWTLRALIVAVGLLIALAVVWFALVQPAIESTARDQANDVLAAHGLSPLPTGDGGPSPSETPDGTDGATDPPGTSPSPEATTTPTAPPGGGAAPADGRLLAGDAAVKPPDGTTLNITDLVFSNPNTTLAGEIRLVRSGTTLLALQLENFRDIDFHFVTPIVVGSDQDLALICGPATGCPNVAVYYSGFVR